MVQHCGDIISPFIPWEWLQSSAKCDMIHFWNFQIGARIIKIHSYRHWHWCCGNKQTIWNHLRWLYFEDLHDSEWAFSVRYWIWMHLVADSIFCSFHETPRSTELPRDDPEVVLRSLIPVRDSISEWSPPFWALNLYDPTRSHDAVIAYIIFSSFYDVYWMGDTQTTL